jgi:hypothetical protein
MLFGKAWKKKYGTLKIASTPVLVNAELRKK